MNLQNNEENLKPISLDEVKNLIKSNDPIFFDKMIIDPNNAVVRTNFLYINYSGEYLNRTAQILKFPMYGSVKDNFEEFKGGVSAHGDKKIINSQHIIKTLNNSFGINPSTDLNSTPDDLEFPIAEINGNVNSLQPLYFLPARTNSWTCENCSGKQYVVCDDSECHGRHEWKCVECNAKGTVTCSNCGGDGKCDCSRCNGSNKVKCTNCGGDGKVNDGAMAKMARGAQSGRQKDKHFQEKSCGKCSGKGQVNCSNCNRGQVTCSRCHGNGKVTCSKCNGTTTIVCSKCYADKERYGKIDCPQCKAMGELGKISFVETIVAEKSISRIFFSNNQLQNFDPQGLMKFAKKNVAQVTILKNFNSTLEQNYASVFSPFMSEIHKELGFTMNGFKNKVTREELACNIIPCVQIEFRHMLTNKTHFATISNFFENPEINIDKSSEHVKSDAKDKFKVLGNFFSKIIKTKAYKDKEDKKREIKLMIMLAKVDGIIEDAEKMFLSSEISHLDNFSVTEKKEFFSLMDAKSLPELSKKDIVFYSKERYDETMSKLVTLASKDGSFEPSEEQFINLVKEKYAEFTQKK